MLLSTAINVKMCKFTCLFGVFLLYLFFGLHFSYFLTFSHFVSELRLLSVVRSGKTTYIYGNYQV